MAFNMPPGCSPNDIPGNGPEDGKAEAFDQLIASKVPNFDKFHELLENTDTFLDQICAKANASRTVPRLVETLFECIDTARVEAERTGYAEGLRDGKHPHNILSDEERSTLLQMLGEVSYYMDKDPSASAASKNKYALLIGRLTLPEEDL